MAKRGAGREYLEPAQWVDPLRLEAHVATDRYLDPPTGLPRLTTLCSALAGRSEGSSVAILLVTIDGFDDLVRRRGHAEGERIRCEIGTALRVLMASGRADVAVGAPGRFVVIGSERGDRTGALAAVVEDLVAGVGARRGRASPAVRVAAGRAPSAAHAARALMAEDRASLPTRAVVVPHCEPVVATRSGRVRGLHVRPSADRTPDDTARAADLVGVAAREVSRWPVLPARAIGTIWIDVSAADASSQDLRRVVEDEWLARGLSTRLGLRVRPDGPDGLDEAPVLRALAADGVRLALVGLSTGLADPAVVDRSVFHELVIDPGLIAGATTNADDAALAWGLAALAARHGLLTTADGVDDEDRLQIAADLGVQRAQGEAFGAMQPLPGALEVWPSRVGLRRDGVTPRPGHVDRGGLRVGARARLARRAAELDMTHVGVRARVQRWIEDATTPAHVRRLLAAAPDGPRWTLAEASLLVALAAG